MKAIELFAGAGGLALGMSGAGFKPVAVIERDRWCCDTLRENRRNKVASLRDWPAPVEGDVRDYDFKKHEGQVQLVTGGPPCQPFSLGGKHRAHKDDRDMWPETVRAVRETKPKAFVFENVKGLTRQAFATYLEYIHLQLRFPEIARKQFETVGGHLARLERHATSRKRMALEYDVVFRVLNAANYGVPQRRERVVFVGFRRDLGLEWSFPEPTHSRAALLADQASGDYWDRHEVARKHRPTASAFAAPIDIFATGTKPWRTVRDALSDLPDPELEPTAAARFANHRFQDGARSYPGHTGSPLDEPAKTLKAGVHGVPGGENMLHRPDGSVRYFTVRESARLQTFPDEFVFHGSWSETMRQLGNAVPVRLARVVADGVAARLRGTSRMAAE
jgi:DNA (cytosine-5)-methyltransferase 1